MQSAVSNKLTEAPAFPKARKSNGPIAGLEVRVTERPAMLPGAWKAAQPEASTRARMARSICIFGEGAADAEIRTSQCHTKSLNQISQTSTPWVVCSRSLGHGHKCESPCCGAPWKELPVGRAASVPAANSSDAIPLCSEVDLSDDGPFVLVARVRVAHAVVR